MKSIRELLSTQENAHADLFKFVHRNCEGLISYIITPTGVGTIIKVYCNVCGQHIDVTDYDCW